MWSELELYGNPQSGRFLNNSIAASSTSLFCPVPLSQDFHASLRTGTLDFLQKGLHKCQVAYYESEFNTFCYSSVSSLPLFFVSWICTPFPKGNEHKVTRHAFFLPAVCPLQKLNLRCQLLSHSESGHF